MARRALALLLAAAALAAASCGGLRADPPREYLDAGTAATITVVEDPFIFARERRDLAANAREYVTLAAAAVNRTGRVDCVWVVYRWSTVDARLDPDRRAQTEPLVIEGDDRRIELASPLPSLHEAGIDEPVHAPPGPRRPAEAYRCDLATLRYLAEVRHVELRAGTDQRAAVYGLWLDGRRSLESFVEYLNGAR